MTARTKLNAKIQELKAQIKELAQTEFKAGAADLFAKYEDLNNFSWTQYTPYFNDGDECTFSVHNEEPMINGYDEYDESEEGKGRNILADAEKTTGWGKDEKVNPTYDAECGKIVKDVQKFLGSFDEDNYKEMFGDHVEVTVSRRGVSVEEYSHD